MSPQEPGPKGVSAGRGVAYIAAAKIYFMIAGAAIEFVLPRLLGRFAFGGYGVVAQFVSNVNNVMVTGTIQAVSRYTTADPARADDVKAAGVRMHLIVGLPLALVYALLSPVWAHLVHDPTKTGPLALSAAILAAYAFYTVFVGSANGTRAFHKQAGLDVGFATLRATAILGAAALGLGIWGAIGAWAAAAVAILVVAALWVGPPRTLRAGAVGPMMRFLGGVALYLIIMNLVMSADQLLLKRLSAEWFVAHPEWLAAHGVTVDGPAALVAEAARQADGQVGFYRAVQNLARLPYQLLIAVTFVIFPLVSRATFEQDAERTRVYIRTTMRYSLVFAGLMGAVLAAESTAALDVPYTAEYAREGGAALAALALGNVAFAIFTIAGTILNGAGKTLHAVLVATGTLAVLVVALFVGIPQGTPGEQMLLICALATTGAMVLGSAISGWVIWRRFGAFIPALTVVRVGVAIAATMAAGRLLPRGGNLLTLVELAVCGVVFLGALIATGELGRADLAMVTKVARRGG